MDHTANGSSRGARGILVASAITLTAGITITVVGLIANDISKFAGGASITIIAIAALGLIVVHRWVTDTSAERERLAAAETVAHTEHARYIAGLAAVDAERARVRRDATTIARRHRAQLEVERDALEATFEAERERITTDAFRTGVLMERAGLLKEPQPASVTNLYARRERRAEAAPAVSRHPS